MAEIPSDIASSAAQAGFQARDVDKLRNADRAGQANASQRQAKAVDEAGNSVDTEDADSQVFTDSEGAGSEGRACQDDASEARQETGDSTSKGITEDEDGHLHLDLEA